MQRETLATVAFGIGAVTFFLADHTVPSAIFALLFIFSVGQIVWRSSR